MKFKDIESIKVRHSLILDKNLTPINAILLSLFLDIDISNGIPSNSELSKLIGISKQGISKSISELIKKGYLRNIANFTDEETYMMLNKKNSKDGCLFCGYDKTSLDEHHYPIRQKDKGVLTISLCPNCHREFHELADHNRKLLLLNWEEL